MASIRLEDEARTDPRFGILGKRLGTSRFDARGRMEELWAYCTEKQTYYLTKEIIDQLAEFEGFAKLIISDEIGLAAMSDKGIRIKGTRGRIEWLKKLRNNGKKGGRPKKTKTKPEGNQTVTKPEPPSNPLITVPVIVPSLVPTKNEELNTVPAGVNPDRPLSARIWETYRDEYLYRYQVEPTRNATVNAQIAQLGKRLGEDAIEVVRFYLRHNKSYYVQASHTIGPLLKDAESLRTQWQRGQAVLTTHAREAERTQHNFDAFDRAADILDRRGSSNGNG